MNILFFLIPKIDVEYIYGDFTIRQTLEKMSYYHYGAIPVISRNGEYLCTISEGDILWHLKKHELNFKDCESHSVDTIHLQRDIQSISIDKEMNDLVNLIIAQNFVPVVDDRNIFIGIITRRSVIKYLQQQLDSKSNS